MFDESPDYLLVALGGTETPDAQRQVDATHEAGTPDTETPQEDEAHEVPAQLVVHTDYRKAMQEAAEDRKMLFIYFHERRPTAAQTCLRARDAGRY